MSMSYELMSAQQTEVAVSFRDQSIQTVEHDGDVFVVMRRIVENLDLSWSTQRQKLMRNADKFGCVHINIPGSAQCALCIPLKKLNGWLFSIDSSKVRADVRPALLAYQEDCFVVLYEHFSHAQEKRHVDASDIENQFIDLENSWNKLYKSISTFDKKSADHINKTMSYVLMFKNTYISSR